MPPSLVTDMLLIHANMERIKAEEIEKETKKINTKR
jgi:hypothetical protein